MNKLKCRFLTHYQFSHVCFEGIGNSVWSVDSCLVRGSFVNNGDRGKLYMNELPPLELKRLSEITDEDALKCWENDTYIPSNEDIKEVKRLFLEMTSVNADYLRSKGYAVPYMGVSVEEMVELNWIKFKK